MTRHGRPSCCDGMGIASIASALSNSPRRSWAHGEVIEEGKEVWLASQDFRGPDMPIGALLHREFEDAVSRCSSPPSRSRDEVVRTAALCDLVVRQSRTHHDIQRFVVVLSRKALTAFCLFSQRRADQYIHCLSTHSRVRLSIKSAASSTLSTST